MNEHEEEIYLRGGNAAWRYMLQECLRNLGHADPLAGQAGWLVERSATVAMLRSWCDGYGDNDWPDELHLADVIEKHLMRNVAHQLEPQLDDDE